MRLPGIEHAIVDAAKVPDYLLSDSHPVGRFKAVFFVSLGYPATEWELIEAGLRGHAMNNDAVASERNEYGQNYEVRVGSKVLSARLSSSWRCGSCFAVKTSPAS